MDDFTPREPYSDDDFVADESGQAFPIAEVFGHHRRLLTESSRRAFALRHCPFGQMPCEKFRQYGYGYCSVLYRASGDEKMEIYAVCDHRLDGPPIQLAVSDYFGAAAEDVVVVPEVVLTNPRQSFDFVAVKRSGSEFIAIEAQAIDLRGGGVGPAWDAIFHGHPRSWRRLYSEEAQRKGRRDNIAYGVNTANIFKRLGLQVAEKAALMELWGGKLYVVTQKRVFDYLTKRIIIDWSEEDPWDITFLTFEYTGDITTSGQLALEFAGLHRTSVASFAESLVTPTTTTTAEDFLLRVRKKAGLSRR